MEKKKVYQVTLDKPLTRTDMEQITEGISLEDGDIYADEVAYVSDNKKEVGIEIHSGRNRIVRRIFEHLGYTVQKLDRVYYAGITKKNLKRGAWRFLTNDEVNRLKSGRYEQFSANMYYKSSSEIRRRIFLQNIGNKSHYKKCCLLII